MKGHSLHTKILHSHFGVAGLGLIVLCISLAAIWYLSNTATVLAKQSGPLAQASLRALNGVQTSIAATRGWVSLGEDEFRTERDKAWSNVIYPSIDEIIELQQPMTEAGKQAFNDTLRVPLAELDRLQWWIEDVAWTPGNEPARNLYYQQAIPIADSVLNSITGLITIEQESVRNAQYKLMLSSMADFRFAFSQSVSILGHFLDDADDFNKAEFFRYFEQAIDMVVVFGKEHKQFTDVQNDMRRTLGQELPAFELIATNIIALRESPNWNVAHKLLADEVVPLARDMLKSLNTMYLQNSTTMDDHARDVTSLRQIFFWGAVGLIITILFLTYKISHHSTRRLVLPIEQLVWATTALTKGEQIEDITVMTDDELGELTTSFNYMREAMDESEAELKQINLELEGLVAERTSELTRSNQELEQFAYIASHDLQEPLRTVTGFVKLLESKCADDLNEDGRKYINFAIEGTERMKALVQGLLDLSRINTSKEGLSVIDSNSVIKSVLADLNSAISTSGAIIEYGELPQVMADDSQLYRLFQNLINNAIKYRADDRSLMINVGAVYMDGRWQFSVNDNGIGIEAKNYERVFQIFQRLHARDEYAGVGIGMAMCKKIVENHGGKIWVESQHGIGSTFYFTLQGAEAPVESVVHLAAG